MLDVVQSNPVENILPGRQAFDHELGGEIAVRQRIRCQRSKDAGKTFDGGEFDLHARRPVGARPDHRGIDRDIAGLQSAGELRTIGGAAEIRRGDAAETRQQRRGPDDFEKLTPCRTLCAHGARRACGASSSNHDEGCPRELTAGRSFCDMLVTYAQPRDAAQPRRVAQEGRAIAYGEPALFLPSPGEAGLSHMARSLHGVVPANAGIHTPCRRVLAVGETPCLVTSARGYGSRPEPVIGRRFAPTRWPERLVESIAALQPMNPGGNRQNAIYDSPALVGRDKKEMGQPLVSQAMKAVRRCEPGGYFRCGRQLQIPPDRHGQTWIRASKAWASSGLLCL